MADTHGDSVMTVEMNGIKETKKALRNSDKVLRKEVRGKFKDIGAMIAPEAASFARSKGLVDHGDLASSIKPLAREMSVVVRDSRRRKSRAYPDGYSYPRRYEFEKQGWRAFMRPALKAKSEAVVAKFREVVAAVGEAFRNE